MAAADNLEMSRPFACACPESFLSWSRWGAFAFCLAVLAVCRPAVASAGASGTVIVPTRHECSWNQPGANPFMGDVVGAVDHYRDIPPAVRQRLKERMQARHYDEIVEIRRDSIVGAGAYDYEGSIRQMHFGTSQLCDGVTRTSWTPAMKERGLVYCESGECVLVPTVCRNVSRITRHPAANAENVAAAPEALPPIDWFGPAGAGRPAADAPAAATGPIGDSSFAAATEGVPGTGSGGSDPAAAPTALPTAFPSSVAFTPLPAGLPTTESGHPGIGNRVAVAQVPEPSEWLLCAAGLLAVAWRGRRRQRTGA